jgi:hypothetical protein
MTRDEWDVFHRLFYKALADQPDLVIEMAFSGAVSRMKKAQLELERVEHHVQSTEAQIETLFGIKEKFLQGSVSKIALAVQAKGFKCRELMEGTE